MKIDTVDFPSTVSSRINFKNISKSQVDFMIQLLSNISSENVKVTIEVTNSEERENLTSENEMDDVKLKEIIIITLIMSIWFYSLYRFFKVWRDILNFSAETLQRTSGYNGPDRLWSIITEYIRSFRYKNSHEQDSFYESHEETVTYLSRSKPSSSNGEKFPYLDRKGSDV